MDEYIKHYRTMVKKAKGNKALDAVLNKVYEDGFEDGSNEGSS